MRILVTGGSGFLGSHIVDAFLREGHEVTALARSERTGEYLRSLTTVRIAKGDLIDAESLKTATRGIDCVVHSAARVLDFGTKEQFYEANVRGTQHLVNAAKKNGVSRFVFVSSPSVVADGTDQIDIDESFPYPSSFLNLYSETKAISEKFVLRSNSPEFITCALRPRAVWGPRDTAGYMPKLLKKLKQGRMPDFSGGRTIHANLCFCENAAKACVNASVADSTRIGGKAYFITDGERIDVWQFMRRVADYFGVPGPSKTISPRVLMPATRLVETLWNATGLSATRSPPISLYGLSLLSNSATFDISAARRDLGYTPGVLKEEGLARLKTWIDSIGGLSAYLASAP